MAFMSRLGSALRQVTRRSDSLQLRAAGATALSVPAVHVLSRGMASSKLFVGGLAWGVDESTVKEAFSSYGEVIDVRIITDRDTGRSRGFGFVSFTNDEDAESALQAMDGHNLAGRTIRVDYAVQKPSGFSRGLGGGVGGGFPGFAGENARKDDLGLGDFGGGNAKKDDFGGLGGFGGDNAKKDEFGGFGGFGGEDAKKNDFDFSFKDNGKDSYVNTNNTGLFGSLDDEGKQDNFAHNASEISSPGSWKNL